MCLIDLSSNLITITLLKASYRRLPVLVSPGKTRLLHFFVFAFYSFGLPAFTFHSALTMKAAVFDFDTSVLNRKSEVECSIQSIIRSSPSKWRLHPYSTHTWNPFLVVAIYMYNCSCCMLFLCGILRACSVVWTDRSRPIPKTTDKNLLFGFNAQSTYRVKLLNCSTAAGGVLALLLLYFWRMTVYKRTDKLQCSSKTTL